MVAVQNKLTAFIYIGKSMAENITAVSRGAERKSGCMGCLEKITEVKDKVFSV